MFFKYSKYVFAILPFTLSYSLNSLYSQQIVSASGGEAIGFTGTMSYTVGQIDYTQNEATQGLLYHGVQQPYVELPTDPPAAVQPCFMYPNPASYQLFLELPTAGETIVHLSILDVRGRVIRDLPYWDRREGIILEDMPSGLYIIRLRDGEDRPHLCRFLKVR
jgi:hypothetical protein